MLHSFALTSLSLRSSIVLALLIGAALAGNYFHLHLFIGTAFLFGSITTLLALRLFGIGWGVVAGMAGSAFALFETSNYAAAATLLVLEPLIVGLALRHGRCRNIVLVDGAFWLLLGMPAMWGMDLWVHHGDNSSAWYFAMILGFNGIFNALVAGLLLDYLPLRRWAAVAEEAQRVALQHLAFNLLAAFLVFSAFFVIVLNGRDEVKRTESRIQQQLENYALEIQSHLVSWSEQREQLVRRLGGMAGMAGSIPVENLQQAADLIKMMAGDLEAVHVGRGDGVAIATSYYGDGTYNGKNLDLSDRLWFQEMKRTLRPVVSDVFVGKVSLAPTLAFGMPLVAAQRGTSELAGYVAVLVRLSELKKLLEMHARANGEGAGVTLLDRQMRVIASTRGDLVEMGHMPSLEQTSVSVWDASAGMVTKGLSLQQIYDARYVSKTRAGPDNAWMLYLEIPVRPYFLALQQRLVNNLGLMWAGIVIAFLVASLVSRRLVEPLERLVEATTHIKARLLGDEDVRLDHSPVREIDALVDNFSEMTLELNRSYTELGRSNSTLEQKVAARTKELNHANQQLTRHLAEREQFEVALARHAQELEQTSAELMSQKFALDQHSIVAITDPQGNITYVNDKFCEISQYSREELLGQNHRILNSGFHERKFFQDMWGTIVSGKVWQGEVRNRKKDGSFYWVESTIAPFMDALGSPYQYVAIRTDITQRKQVELDLQHAKETAETANRAKSEFLSRMSHELRTPLNAILGFGQLLESDPDEPLTASQEENVEQILKAGWHLLELVNEVLDLARIEAGKMRLHMADVRASEVIEECLDLITPLAAERQILVHDEISACLPHLVRADRIRLKQVILNYLSNAVKYNRQGGAITLKCEHRPLNVLRLNVIDTGPGIPADMMGQLFEPFNRLNADVTEIQGTGAGLAVAKRLMDLMGGSVGANSEVGRGSTFWIEVPEVFSAQEGTDEPETQVEFEAGQVVGNDSEQRPDEARTLLLVEDNRPNRDLVASIIKHHRPKLRLVCTETAEEGLEYALSEHPDLILMDINLPGLSGLEALALLREFDALRAIPVIAMSADAMTSRIEKCMLAGFSHYLTKPLSVDNFLNVLDVTLAATRSRTLESSVHA